jgi:hypothetical protein
MGNVRMLIGIGNEAAQEGMNFVEQLLAGPLLLVINLRVERSIGLGFVITHRAPTIRMEMTSETRARIDGQSVPHLRASSRHHARRAAQ